MKLLARGTSIGPDNPQLVFFHQIEGLLSDVDALWFRIEDVRTDDAKLEPVELVAMTSVDVSAGSAARLGIGRYAASWALPADLPIGLYQIEWIYRLTPGGPLFVVRTTFDVVPGLGVYAAGPFYCGLSSLRDEGFTEATLSNVRALAAIVRASRYVETITRRIFEPRYLTLREDGGGGPLLALSLPIIGLDELAFDTYPYEVSALAEEESRYRIYNRHLRGQLLPDDRLAPAIGLSTYDSESAFSGLLFPSGKQNVEVRGVFGYTDPDGSPCGETPLDIVRVTQMLLAKDTALMSDTDAREDANFRSRLTGERTRDQSYTLGSNGDLGLFTGFTGDAAIDQILLRYLPPLAVGSA